MATVCGERNNRNSAGLVGLPTRAAVLLFVALAGTLAILVPPSLWLSAAPDESSALPAPGETLADVRIEGNVTIPAEHIAKYIRTRPGRPYSEKQIQSDVKSLFATRWFFRVEPRFRRSKNGLVLIFDVLERPVVRKVQYLGNEKIKTKHLEKITGLKKGSPFTVSANRESARRIEAYYKKKGYIFAEVTLERGGDRNDRDVIFRIKEGPKVRVGSVKFHGNKFVSGPVLLTKIRTKRAILWLIGGLFDPATIDDDILALKQYYHNLGFFDVDVSQKETFSKGRSLVTLNYTIREGRRYKVRRIVVEGNDVLTTKNIRGDMKVQEGDYFNALHLAKDIDKIKEKYGHMGRIFAKVEAAPRFFEGQNGRADLVYRIDEDHVYRIRRVNVVFRDGQSHTMKTVALNRMLIHPGDLADPKLIRRSKQRLTGTQIFASGQQNPALAPEIIFKPVKPSIAEGLGGRQFRGQNSDDDEAVDTPVRRTTTTRRVSPIRWNSPNNNPFDLSNLNPDGTVKRQSITPETRARPASQSDPNPLPFTEGPQPIFYQRTYPKPTIRGQNFEQGQPTPGSPLMNDDPNRPFPEAVREGDLLLNLSETQTGRLMFGVGVNSSSGLVGSIVLSEYNFNILRPPTSWQDIANGEAWRGGGQRFRLEAVPGNIVSRYMASWSDPYFLNTNYSLSVSGFYYNRFFRSWNEERTGGRVAFGRQWTPAFSTTGAFRIEDVTLSNPDVPTPQLLQESLGTNLLTTFSLTLAHDTRDRAFLPGAGHLVEFATEQAFSLYDYTKLTLSGSQYFTLYERPDGYGRQIVTLRGQLGWTDAGTPIFERFFAGGYQTFRGFQFRGVTPRQFNVGIGGRWLALGTAEYMVPLLANEMIQGVAFTDFGTVEEKVGFHEFRLSVGAGLRITVPAMGPVPLAFDFGFPILKEDFDKERIFNFYVGITR